MRRFFVPAPQCREDVFDLPEREARHAAQVLRLGPGDELAVLDGAGSVLHCVVDSASKRNVRVRVRERRHCRPLPCAITLIQALPRGPAFESIVQKATELGAARIIPLLSNRVVAQVIEGNSPAKVEKWRQIAVESIKQCGSPWLPDIQAPVRIETVIATFDPAGGARVSTGQPEVEEEESPTPLPRRESLKQAFHPALPAGSGKVWVERSGRRDDPACAASEVLSVVCSLQETQRSLRDVVAGFVAAHGRRPASAVIWIGPEGDFSPDEYAAIAKTGASPITLGPLVLRADTAAIACLAVANHELQSRD